MATEKTASFAIAIPTEAPGAKEAASDLEALRAKIFASQEAVKNYGSALRSLRGASDDVKEARSQLKAKVDAERDAMSRANLQLVKQGTTYEHLTKQQRDARAEKEKAAKSKLAEQAQKERDAVKRAADALLKHTESSKATADAVRKVGGPVSELREKLEGLKGVLGGMTTAEGALAVGATLMVAAVAAAAAAVIGLTAAVVAGTIAFARFVVEGANAARTMGLMREAAGGSASNANALGHQVDALAQKLATPKAELNELALTMTRSMLGTRIGGQGIVDTFNAVAQASEAMGKTAGSKIQEIIERSKTWGRMGLGRFELQGTGITFEDVAGNLSKQLKIGLNDARFQLLAGWTDVNQGAKAIRTAIETRFASINLRKMLDWDVIKLKFHETLAALTTGVNLEPLLRAFTSLTDLFTDNTVAGAALKDIVTDLGNDLVGGAASGADFAKKAIKQLIIWTYQADIAFIKWRRGILDTKAKLFGLISVNDAITAVKVAIGAVGVALAGATIVVAGFVAAFAAIGKVVGFFTDLQATVEGFGDRMRTAAAELGKQLIEGITEGIRNAWNALKAAIGGVADSIKTTFKNLLGIHSPSKIFEGYGKQTVEGYGKGVEAKQGGAQQSVNEMAPSAPPGAAGATAGRGGGPITLNVQIQVPDGGKGAETAKALSSPDFLAQLTKAIEEALVGAGIPTQTAAGG